MSTVESFIEKHSNWKTELNTLREILQKTDLEESIKWGSPVYSFGTKNVVGLGAFKSYVGIWLFQGVFLSDQKGVLENAQEGKTKALRQWRFHNVNEIDSNLVAQYVEEAIQNQKDGKELKADRKKELNIPPELEKAFQADRELQSAYNSLTPGKQREYADYISEAKQEKTKLSRLEKITPMVLAGKGLYDKYKNC